MLTLRHEQCHCHHTAKVENGDLNWIVPGKLVAFSGPAVRPTDYVGFRAMVPEDYWDYFSRRGVQAVVRLNKKVCTCVHTRACSTKHSFAPPKPRRAACRRTTARTCMQVYERKRFLDGGFQHHELYFPDGSCPSQDILLRFLALAEATPGALAVHCKAGLGRTGVLICSYIMKHYGFTAEEVIGYIRVCRPGSVIGPQQGFIRDIQHIMWAEGDAYRSAHGPHPPPLMWGLTAAAAAKAAAGSKGRASAAAAAAAGPINLLVDATGQQVVVTRGSPGSARLVPASQGEHACWLLLAPGVLLPGSKLGSSSALLLACHSACPAAVTAAAAGQLASAPVTPAAGVHGSLTDLSLKQLQERLTHSSISAATASNTAGASSRARGVTPQRLLSASSSATQQQQLPATSFSARHSSSQMTLRGSPVGGGSVNGGIAGRSMSASRDRPASHSGTGAIASGSVAGSLLAYAQPSLASLRATLHTDTVTAAARHKVQPQAPISQSSDFVGSGWRTPLTSSGSGSGSSSAGSTIARVLAPNGQPRKMPASALAGLAGSGSGSGAAKGMQSPGTPVQQGAQHGRLSAYYS